MPKEELVVQAVNLYPERRRQQRKRQMQTLEEEQETEQESKTATDSIPSSTPSENLTIRNGDKTDTKQTTTEEDESVSASPRVRKRQQLLSFNSQGALINKQPSINPISRNDERRKALAAVASETHQLLPGLLATRPDVTSQSYLCQRQTLDPTRCPNHPPCAVRVVSADTIDAALALQQSPPSSTSTSTSTSTTSPTSSNPDPRPVCILNMANARSPGGGWRHGALAQEEALCYRTSLSRTLHARHYPLPDDGVLYSPTILVIRESFNTGHALLGLRTPAALPVLAAISCAAVELPPLKTANPANNTPSTGSGSVSVWRKTYRDDRDRRLMRTKMREVLRTAIRNRHRQLVLGALGCGAFGNPNWEVARLWKDVLQEAEFKGGYWRDIVFAVLDDGKGVGNFAVFKHELDGLVLK